MLRESSHTFICHNISTLVGFLILPLVLLPVQAAPTSSLVGIYNQLMISSEHQAYILETGDDALLARVHLIRNAKSTIAIQTFIWANDATGRFVFNELYLG